MIIKVACIIIIKVTIIKIIIIITQISSIIININ